MTRSTWIMLTGLSVLWGAAFLFNEIALTAFPPLTLVTLRVGIGALTLMAIIAVRGRRTDRPYVRPEHIGMALLANVLPFFLIVEAQTQITGGLASIINAGTPIWALIVAHFLTSDERFTANKAAGTVLGFAGVVVLIGPSVLFDADGTLIAQLAVIGATICYGFAATYGKRFKGDDPIETAAAQLIWSSLLVAPVALLVDRPWTLAAPGADAVGAILAIGIAATGFAYILFFTILKRAGATNVMLVTLLVPVSAVFLGWLVLGERLDPWQGAGMTLIASGLLLIDGRLVAAARVR